MGDSSMALAKSAISVCVAFSVPPKALAFQGWLPAGIQPLPWEPTIMEYCGVGEAR